MMSVPYCEVVDPLTRDEHARRVHVSWARREAGPRRHIDRARIQLPRSSTRDDLCHAETILVRESKRKRHHEIAATAARVAAPLDHETVWKLDVAGHAIRNTMLLVVQTSTCAPPFTPILSV